MIPKTYITYRAELDDESVIILAFTEDNNLNDDKEFLGWNAYECYDKDDNRYVCYINDDNEYIMTLKSIKKICMVK